MFHIFLIPVLRLIIKLSLFHLFFQICSSSKQFQLASHLSDDFCRTHPFSKKNHLFFQWLQLFIAGSRDLIHCDFHIFQSVDSSSANEKILIRVFVVRENFFYFFSRICFSRPIKEKSIFLIKLSAIGRSQTIRACI